MIQPTVHEQYMLELINRARLNPSAEADLYGIDLNEGLTPNTISNSVKQPLAFNLSLTDVANSHSQWMLDSDTFSHTGAGGSSPGDRLENAGYQYTTLGENIGYFGTTGTLNVTEATSEVYKSLFKSTTGHRQNILNNNFREIGLATLTGDFDGYNSLMVTQNFATTGSSTFLTGVAFKDEVIDDDFYSVGEGLAGITVTAVRQSDNSSFATDTMSAGGYQIALTPGIYNVSFAKDNQTLGSTRQINLGSDNIKLDLNTDANIISGTTGNDILNGTASNDLISANAGNDRINASAGNDTLNGGAGSDRLFAVSDRDLTLTNNQLQGLGRDNISQIEFANLYGQTGNNLIDASQSTQIQVVIRGNDGNDTLHGGQMNDTIFGGDGNDEINISAGNDTLNGGAGSDRLFVFSDRDLTLTNNQLKGLGTDDISRIEFANLYGRAKNNLIDASQSTQIQVVIRGNDGNDTLHGGQMNDTIFGGNGNDIIFGGNGDDILIGNSGADIFALESGQGTIKVKDFDNGSDLLGLTSSLSFNDLYITNNSAGTKVVIQNMADGDQVLAILDNVSAADVTPIDFTTV